MLSKIARVVVECTLCKEERLNVVLVDDTEISILDPINLGRLCV